MSLVCYDFQKWSIISMAAVAISLTIGLLSLAYGQDWNTAQNMTQEQREGLINYCYQHADRPNPLQDLIDKGFLPEGFKETCKSVKQTYDKVQLDLKVQQQKQQVQQQKQQQKLQDLVEKTQQKLRDIEEKQRLQYEAYLKEQAMNNTNFNNCLSQNMSVELCYDTHIGNRPAPP